MGEARKSFPLIWSLTWPLMVANALDLAVGLADLWLVRPFGPAATAAIGVSRQVTFLVDAMAVAVTSGVLALVSQAVGVSTRRLPFVKPTALRFEPDELVRQSAGLVLLLALPTALAGYFLSGPLLFCLRASEDTRAFGEPYLQTYFVGLVFSWGYLLGIALFRGAGDVWTPLKLTLGVSLSQIGLNYLLIYGGGPVPALEVQGAAVGAVLARACGVLAFLVLLWRGTGQLRLRRAFPLIKAVPKGEKEERAATVREREQVVSRQPLPDGRGSYVPLGNRPFGFDWTLIGHLLRIGIPMALANVFRHGSRVVFMGIGGATVLGASLQAALGVALQFRLMGVLAALAFQTAAATLVGQAIGRNDPNQAETLGWRSVQLLALLMGIVAALLIVLAEPLAGLFIDAPEVAALAARVIRWFAVAQFFSALSIGLQGALLGAGDTLPALRYTLLSEWCLMLPLALAMVEIDWVPDGLLAAWVVAPALTLALMVRRFRGGRWKALPSKVLD